MKLGGLAIGLSLFIVLIASAPASAATISLYNNIPDPVPSNVASLGFEATETQEFGSQVSLDGTPGADVKVAVLMSSWACQKSTWDTGDCESALGASFKHPVTLKIYKVGPNNSVGNLVIKHTREFSMPYRPSADSINCTGADSGKWFDGASCNNGKAFTIRFNLGGVDLPDKFIVGISYNTTHYGYKPIGTSADCYGSLHGCPYDSLNVGTNPAPSTGSYLPSADDAYWNTYVPNYYADSGLGGVGAFRLDSGGWTGYLPAIRVYVNGPDPLKNHSNQIENNSVKADPPASYQGNNSNSAGSSSGQGNSGGGPGTIINPVVNPITNIIPDKPVKHTYKKVVNTLNN
ncbi:MAG TPA: hypothetical protein VFW77_03420, partial [Candidatus Saccharimonadales bacterium]|nr:hypothetical protein [Candidatus Saccharimonadales bacterium]